MGFYDDLRTRVDAYLAEHAAHGRFDDGRLRTKTLVLLVLFAALYAAWLLDPLPGPGILAVAIAWGAVSALLTFNVPHDALHQAFFEDRRLNRLAAQTFRLAGLDPDVWHLKHDLAHHGFTNVPGRDPDVDAWPLFRFAPTDRVLFWHRWQHLYAVPVYLSTSLFFIFFLDVKLALDGELARRHGVTRDLGFYARLALTKAGYLALALGLPLWLTSRPGWHVVGAFVAMHAVIGLASALVLLPSHCMEHARWHPVESPPHKGDAFVLHALSTTLDFAPRSRVVNWLLGGFNTNVLHHVFPTICHVHYVELTDILRQTAADHGVAYHAMSLGEALRSHFRFLRRMGTGTAWALEEAA